MKIVLNNHFGGFCLAPEVMAELGIKDANRLGYIWNDDFPDLDLCGDIVKMRSHPRLIAAVEKVGVENAHRDWARGDSLRIVEVPDDAVTVYITDYDGREGVTWSMAEIHHA